MLPIQSGSGIGFCGSASEHDSDTDPDADFNLFRQSMGQAHHRCVAALSQYGSHSNNQAEQLLFLAVLQRILRIPVFPQPFAKAIGPPDVLYFSVVVNQASSFPARRRPTSRPKVTHRPWLNPGNTVG